MENDSNAENIVPIRVTKEGMVTKQGGRIKTWKKRWCVLAENGLFYYKTPQQYTNLQGQIDLSLVETVEPVQEKAKKKFCFRIVTPGRIFIISANNEEDMNSWIQEIKAMKEKTSGQKTTRGSQPVEELEQLLSSVDDRMKAEWRSTFI
eukprot:TRINITY_DN6221_c0_g1_i3.p1 TRINITY_DN6221_c0_g1~~TRINITY_DN6221_c0_g1_i3.p1  ORF type:complete len:149 (+),score=29.91 TRINITY_DN6221_c0_g1_i3:241-687(+)